MVNGLWRLERFAELFDDFTANNVVSDGGRRAFRIWLAKLATDPRGYARPAADAPAEFDGRMWFALIPGTLVVPQVWLTCTFQVFPQQRTAVCSHFAYLSGPFMEYPELT